MATRKTTWRLLTLVTGLVALAAVPAMGGTPSWELVDSAPNHSDFFYDKGGVKKLPAGIVMVTAKVAYAPEGRQEVLDTLKNEKYRSLSYSLYSYEVNCAKGESRLVAVKHADAKGEAIAEFDLAGKADWEEIPVGSRLDMVVDEQCPAPRR